MPARQLILCVAAEISLTILVWECLEPLGRAGADRIWVSRPLAIAPPDRPSIKSTNSTDRLPSDILNMVAINHAPTPAKLKAGEERTFEIADGIRVTFCWIPPGKNQLGSPKAERESVLRNFKMNDEPAWLVAEAEERRKNYTNKGFWLGKYEVTQGEWKCVMGSNPSTFDGKKPNKAKGADTQRFPVETVSWENCQAFVTKINDRARATKLFDTGVRFSLPTENEWEFAYRGGKENKTAFYWGNCLSGKEANCNEDSYGTTAPTTCLDRPCAVEFTNDGNYKKHPWGLMHMSGNITEWCSDKYEANTRILRGGSWKGAAVYCRGACRTSCEQDVATDGTGLRLAIVSN